MSPEQERIVNRLWHPPFASVPEAAALFNRTEEEIKILDGEGFLRPCGRRRPRNGKVMYSTKEIFKLAEDPKTTDRIADIIFGYWERKNRNRNKRKSGSHQASEAA